MVGKDMVKETAGDGKKPRAMIRGLKPRCYSGIETAMLGFSALRLFRAQRGGGRHYSAAVVGITSRNSRNWFGAVVGAVGGFAGGFAGGMMFRRNDVLGGGEATGRW
ncbi:hypothetical protein AB6D20_027950 (plasmid) [Vibrio splendidus]